jgi:hypothetical protein
MVAMPFNSLCRLQFCNVARTSATCLLKQRLDENSNASAEPTDSDVVSFHNPGLVFLFSKACLPPVVLLLVVFQGALLHFGDWKRTARSPRR